jgi:serine/threonine protein kinase
MDSASARRSQMTFNTTASSILGQNNVSLDNIMGILARNDVPGPYALEACHKGAVSLGAGAQFDVYGRRMPVATGVSRFDGPYLEEPLWRTENGTPETFTHTSRHVAIKRAYLSEHRTPRSVLPVKSTVERGVERSQLRNITHEILALVHPLLRQHPNIVSILGWGYDQAENDNAVFSPVLIVEHARMSAEALASQSDLPLAIRTHVCHGMLSGIKALHECAIVHCDIKPGNILVFARNDSPFLCIAKVSDFGFAEQEIRSRSIAVSDLPRGTTGWAAPEQESGNSIPIELVHRRDIWGCGLTVWSIMALHGQTPRMTNDAKVQVFEDFANASVPVDIITALLVPLLSTLRAEVSNRADSVEGIRSVLEQKDWPESVEIKQKWVYSPLS